MSFENHQQFVNTFLSGGEFISIPLEDPRFPDQFLLIPRIEIIDKMDELYKKRCRQLLDGDKPIFAGLYYEAKAICIAKRLPKPKAKAKKGKGRGPRPSWQHPNYVI